MSRIATALRLRRPPWKTASVVVALLGIVLALNEAQRITAQWQAHQERQAQLYTARANGMKLDKVIEQNDLQLRLLMQHSTDLERLKYTERERSILGLRSAQ